MGSNWAELRIYIYSSNPIQSNPKKTFHNKLYQEKLFEAYSKKVLNVIKVRSKSREALINDKM